MADNYIERPLYQFCLEEADYRVMNFCPNGFETGTIAELLTEKGEDVNKFIREYAERLYDNADYWIREETLRDYLNEMVDDYDLEKEN